MTSNKHNAPSGGVSKAEASDAGDAVNAEKPTGTARKPIDLVCFLICMALCFIWGLQQVAIKAAANDVSPMLQVGIRSGISALLLYFWNKFVSKETWSKTVRLRDALLVGLGFTGEFLFVAEGLRFTSASHMSVLLYTAPLFAAIGLSIRLPEERLSVLQWLGLVLAFFGIALAFLEPALLDGSAAGTDLWLLGDFLGLCAGLSWGLTIIFLRTTTMNEAKPTQMLFAQLATGFAVLFPFALLSGQNVFHSSLIGWSSLAFQTLIVSFASYLIWCGLLKRYLAARLGVLIFVTPIFGVVLSILLLDETVGSTFVAGSLCVLAGLLLVQGADGLKRLFGRRRERRC